MASLFRVSHSKLFMLGNSILGWLKLARLVYRHWSGPNFRSMLFCPLTCWSCTMVTEGNDRLILGKNKNRALKRGSSFECLCVSVWFVICIPNETYDTVRNNRNRLSKLTSWQAPKHITKRGFAHRFPSIVTVFSNHHPFTVMTILFQPLQ